MQPGTEVQAAGRIHRLGQSKQVLCKRFCFRDTYEERVCELHKRFQARCPSPYDSLDKMI